METSINHTNTPTPHMMSSVISTIAYRVNDQSESLNNNIENSEILDELLEIVLDDMTLISLPEVEGDDDVNMWADVTRMLQNESIANDIPTASSLCKVVIEN
jgi:hypothetical protein